MRIYKLTNLSTLLASALGSGRFDDISHHDVVRRIEEGSIFKWLVDRLDAMVPFSALTPVDKLELLCEWEDMIGCVDPLRYNGHRNGLALLIAYLQQGILLRADDANYRLTPETACIWDPEDTGPLMPPTGDDDENDAEESSGCGA